MSSIFKLPISNAAKLMLVVFVIVGAVRMIDFIYYGQELRTLVSGIGFALMAYGLYKNGFSAPAQDKGGQLASYVGVALVLASIAARYLA